MKRWIGLLLAVVLCVNCFGAMDVQAEDRTYTIDEMESLVGTVWYPGDWVYFDECWAQLVYGPLSRFSTN